MKHHVFTATLLLIAILLYAAGYGSGAFFLIAVGAILEGWFWVRLLRRGSPRHRVIERGRSVGTAFPMKEP